MSLINICQEVLSHNSVSKVCQCFRSNLSAFEEMYQTNIQYALPSVSHLRASCYFAVILNMCKQI